jgi:hypothetical protein
MEIERIKTDEDARVRSAKRALRAMSAVRAHQRHARVTGMEAARGMAGAIADLLAGLEHLCEREGLSFERLRARAVREGGAGGTNAELAERLRAVRDEYARRLARERDRELWLRECDELAGWIEEGK